MNQPLRILARFSAAGAAGAIALAATVAPLTAAPLTPAPLNPAAADEAMMYWSTSPSSSAVAVSADTLTEAEITDILFMIEEEKLAHDVYLTLGDIWGTPIFTNIARAESMHMSSVESLITRYGLDDPVDDNPVGVFVDPTLQSMYDDLVVTGSQSLIDALEVGALIEEVDIKDLIESIDETEAIDVLLVWEQLLSGSQNHLKAFTSQLASQDAVYEPTVLDAETYDEMLSEAGQGHGATESKGPDSSSTRRGGQRHGRNG